MREYVRVVHRAPRRQDRIAPTRAHRTRHRRLSRRASRSAFAENSRGNRRRVRLRRQSQQPPSCIRCGVLVVDVAVLHIIAHHLGLERYHHRSCGGKRGICIGEYIVQRHLLRRTHEDGCYGADGGQTGAERRANRDKVGQLCIVII